MKDMKQLEGKSYTRARKRQSQTEIHQSARTDHAGQKNYTIDWEGVRLTAKDTNYKKRGIREAIHKARANMITNFC